jgi:hypothetical protein
MSSAVTPIQSRRDPWTDDLMLNKHGVPLGNLPNVVHALREQGDGCLWDCSGMRLSLPPRDGVKPDTPLRLTVAAALAFPDGSMTASGRHWYRRA